MDKNLTATLYLNRASLFFKKGLSRECLRDCNRALKLSPSYSKAWYRRGKANVAIGKYEDALLDLNASMCMESSLGGKRQILGELYKIEAQYGGSRCMVAHDTDTNIQSYDEPCNGKLVCVTTPNKGRGFSSCFDIPHGSLLHKEEPYALIPLKNCKETHCHYCLIELPIDAVPCHSCTIPLYCSQNCQIRAGSTAKVYGNHDKINVCHDRSLEKHIEKVTFCADPEPFGSCFPEHKHECLGAHWPAVLPPDIVLAGRIIARTVSLTSGSMELNLSLDLSHNYSKATPEAKLELHLFAIILLFCLRHSSMPELPINGISVAQTIILISQISINSMAIVQMRNLDDGDELSSSSLGATLSSVEQVRVGEAIYLNGSLFNHCCRPNVHAYFLSRTLFLRATEFVAANCPLEMSYGPQVGQSGCKERLDFLAGKYSFRCEGSCCSELNMADLVISALRCTHANSNGLVLGLSAINPEIDKLKDFLKIHKVQNLEPPMLVDELGKIDVDGLERLKLEPGGGNQFAQQGYCLACGSLHDLEASHEVVRNALSDIKSLQDTLIMKETPEVAISNASSALSLLKSILHPYNKKIAEAHDCLAQAFCSVGDLQSALNHCYSSIKVLEVLYGGDHIVMGNELVKLATIKLLLGDSTALESVNKLTSIFGKYYGKHVGFLFPHLHALARQACNLVR